MTSSETSDKQKLNCVSLYKTHEGIQINLRLMEILKFRLKSDMILFAFQKDHDGWTVNSGFRGGKDTTGSIYCSNSKQVTIA